MVFLFVLTETTKAQLILLNRILFSLPVAAANAFGGQALVSESSPGTEILATFAPLYFQSIGYNHPDSGVTGSTQALVLTRDDVGRALVLVGRRRGGTGYVRFY